MLSLKQTIMRRDNISSDEADEQIAEAQEELQAFLDEGDTESADDICQTYFGLDPDYLIDLI